MIGSLGGVDFAGSFCLAVDAGPTSGVSGEYAGVLADERVADCVGSTFLKYEHFRAATLQFTHDGCDSSHYDC